MNLLFLTACINPKGMPLTRLQDADERKAQYVRSLHFHLANTTGKVLFVENSGTDISSLFLQEIGSGRLEMICFEGNNFDKTLGKGFGEMEIIEHAFQYSQCIKEADFIFKITGRLMVGNVKEYIAFIEKNNQIDVYADLRTLSLTFADSRFWGAKKHFWLTLITQKHLLNDSTMMTFEHVLGNTIHNAIINKYVYSPLNYLPRYLGISGTDNIQYNGTFWYWFPRNLKHKLRYALNQY